MKHILWVLIITSCAESTTRHDPATAPVPEAETVPYRYSWLDTRVEAEHMLVNRVPVPAGFTRLEMNQPSFGDWLRHLPVKPGKPDVRLYNGQRKVRQNVHHVVMDIDVGDKDLQQCADAVMRLRAEYLYETRQFDRLHFNFTSGDVCAWNKWREGYRPVIRGNHVSWSKSAPADDGYANFRSYLDMVFNYAGTFSLRQELAPRSVPEMMPGDVFIEGGFPGHAVIVLDVAEDAAGERLFLLGQSYMPAQEVHVLVAFESAESPWYGTDFGETLQTPEWTFDKSDLRRF